MNPVERVTGEAKIPSRGHGGQSHGFVDVADVYFAYGQNLVLEDISFKIKKGEFVAIIGPSGCGKSTLLRTIQGLLRPSHGEVTVDGVNVDGPSGNRAMVFQHFALLPWKTVLANVVLALKYKGIGKPRDRIERARKNISMVGLSHCENLYPYQLSGGMRQRVGVARAFAVEASVLLLDEPFGALDAQNAEIMREELSRLVRQEGSTAIMVTHNLDEALGLTDRVLVMGTNPGAVVEDVQVAEIRDASGDASTWTQTSAYHRLRDRLWSILRDEVLRAQTNEIANAT